MVRVKKIASFFLVVLFVSYYASANFFTHSHEFSWGAVTHSHIHTDSHHDTKSGGHTKHEITLIAQMSSCEYVDFLCDHVAKPTQLQLNDNKFVETAHWVESIYFQNLSLRAPPVV